MTAVLFAALSGLSYGAGDFSGAFASKRNNAVVVTAVMQVISLLSLLAVIAFLVDGELVYRDLVWGAIGGLGAAVALVTFYKALAVGPMSTAAAVTALLSAVIPVTVGLLIGEVPNNTTLFGIALAIPAGIIISVGAPDLHGRNRFLNPREQAREKERVASTRRLSIVAGIGFGLFFVALAQVSDEGGLYPLLGARGASIGALLIVIAVTRTRISVARQDWGIVGVTGLLDCAANSFYLIALETGSFTWVAAITSLYPVGTVLLARAFLKERIAPAQVAGLGMAAGALVLVAVGAT